MGRNSVVNVKNIAIGTGLPKICVPVVGKTQDTIIEQMQEAVSAKADLIEWRADFYEDLSDKAKLNKILSKINSTIGQTPLLFTIRTKNEGGEIDISKSDYLAYCTTACESTFVDLLDIEVFFDSENKKTLLNIAHENNVKVIMSNHDFSKTPTEDSIKNVLITMYEYGADIAKIAVMPNSESDVITLMSAITNVQDSVEIPTVAISMGELGKISRICGKLIGSAITFGVAKFSSAPGQVEVKRLRELMQM